MATIGSNLMFEAGGGFSSALFTDRMHKVADSEADKSTEQTKQKQSQTSNSVSESEKSDLNSVQKKELSDQENREVTRLKRTDREVRAHEQAHKSVAGPYSRGAIQFRYETGPDGKRYVVGGEVNVDFSKVQGDPQATVQKMRQIKQAALAPSDPSPQDRRAAMHATRIEAQAQVDAQEKAAEESAENQKQEEKDRNSVSSFDINADHSGIVSPTEAITKFKENLRLDLVSNLFELYT